MTYLEEMDIIEKRKNGVKISQIMSEYNIKSVKTIYDIIKRKGIKKVGNKKYSVNDNYFNEIDTEDKAYWLGFLFADGYVRMKNNRSGQLKLKLSIKDKDHIILFNKYLSSNYLIKNYTSQTKYKNRFSISNVSEVSIYNSKIVKDLVRHGCVNNKTFLIKFPDIEAHLYRHFIRGYFDGDGCIYKLKNRPNSFSISIVSNFQFVSDIKDKLGYGKIYQSENIHILLFNKISEIKNFCEYIYKDSTIFLERKKQIFDKIK